MPVLRPDQSEIVQHPAHVKVVACGRRYGKTTMGGCMAITAAAMGAKVAWTAPTYKNTRSLWRWAERVLVGAKRQRAVRIQSAERVIEFPNTGGMLAFYSADNPDAMRGEWFHLAIIDEAARVSEEAWVDVIQPTLADVGGDALLISTPTGKGSWFYRMWALGRAKMDAEIAAWQAPTTANPNPNIQKAAELARRRVPIRTYKQEWLAEFTDDGGGVFRNIYECATSARLFSPQPGRAYTIGVDWGRTNDATCMVVMDILARREVHRIRLLDTPYPDQRQRLSDLIKHWGAQVVIAEANSMGQPIIEEMLRLGLPIVPYVTTNQSKALIVDALALAFEHQEVSILPDDPMLVELDTFEAVKLPSGAIRYAASGNGHDDCVMALALAYYGCAAGGPLFAWDSDGDELFDDPY